MKRSFLTAGALMATAASALALPRLSVSPDKHFFVKEDGKPFVWIGDTFWKMPYVKEEIHEKYLHNRKKKGFTIIQVRLDTDRNVPNAYGIKPFSDDFMQMPDEEHWQMVDRFISMAADSGLYVAPVLCWGEPGKLGQLTEEQIYSTWKWLGARYKNVNHIVWMTVGEGGRSNVTRAKFTEAARGIRDGIAGGTGGKLLTIHSIWGNSPSTTGLDRVVDFRNWQTSQWCAPEHLPTTSRTPWSEPAKAGSWTAWEAIAADYNRTPVKPVIDAEAWYEGDGSGDCKKIFSNGGSLPHNVRRRAWFTILAGACGHTYGADGVWNARPDFLSLLDLPGSGQIKHVSDLLHSLGDGFLKIVPDQSMIASGQSDSYDHHVQAARASDGSYGLVYVAGGDMVGINLSKITAKNVKGRWYDPRTGEYTALGTLAPTENVPFDPPGAPGAKMDWVLVLNPSSDPVDTTPLEPAQKSTSTRRSISDNAGAFGRSMLQSRQPVFNARGQSAVTGESQRGVALAREGRLTSRK